MRLGLGNHNFLVPLRGGSLWLNNFKAIKCWSDTAVKVDHILHSTTLTSTLLNGKHTRSGAHCCAIRCVSFDARWAHRMCIQKQERYSSQDWPFQKVNVINLCECDLKKYNGISWQRSTTCNDTNHYRQCVGLHQKHWGQWFWCTTHPASIFFPLLYT